MFVLFQTAYHACMATVNIPIPVGSPHAIAATDTLDRHVKVNTLKIIIG